MWTSKNSSPSSSEDTNSGEDNKTDTESEISSDEGENNIKVNETPNTKANYWLMCVELECLKDRDLFLTETNNSKVMTRPIWQLIFKSPIYSSYQRDAQENALFLEDRIVNIPSSVR